MLKQIDADIGAEGNLLFYLATSPTMFKPVADLIAGVLYAARYGTLDATVGTGLELQVVAAAVVGGVAIFGGSGTAFGAALGALLLTTIGNALPVLHVSDFWQQAFVGALILAAIGLDRLLVLRLARQMKGKRAHGA